MEMVNVAAWQRVRQPGNLLPADRLIDHRQQIPYLHAYVQRCCQRYRLLSYICDNKVPHAKCFCSGLVAVVSECSCLAAATAAAAPHTCCYAVSYSSLLTRYVCLRVFLNVQLQALQPHHQDGRDQGDCQAW